MEIYKTIKLRINCNEYDLKRLEICNKESAHIWNLCIKENKMNFEKNKELLSKGDLQSFVKKIDVSTICAFNKTFVSRRVFEAYKAISKARKSGRKDLYYPYKDKKFFPTEWDSYRMHFNYADNIIYLATARYIGNDGKPHNGKQIVLKFKTPIPHNIKTLKLVYEHGHYYACISYLIEVKEKKPFFSNKASIDLGEIHAITSVDNNRNQLIITGRKIRSIKQFRNKRQAELRSKMDRCKKGSRQYNKYRIAYAKIKSKCRKQLDYHIHKLTRMYTNWAIEKGISVVYCGDVTGIEYGTNAKGNSFTRQKINQWEYGKIMRLLEYKLRLEGIQFEKVDESYSSQICPCCGFKNKPKNRNYRCDNCEEEFHRDIVGAWNILSNNCKLDFTPSNYTKYLRIA
ncbi:RNA-guided endonuclease InsQ/TnpB family protein [Paenibacillus naphthalenovorans]|uniref:Transposase IS605 n=1 Tax=Paenibacillus naphthalenovorans TaxID=162209 RepID=A0A0U2VRG5_9BACL|nr:RNA-guided endonuclease TnpB family protein [Paenibacillus naphthalenovorans]ALS22087.1 transposase IS605 [Paenibacillus naphthalenovorans]